LDFDRPNLITRWVNIGDFLIKHDLNFVSHWISIDGQGLSLTSFQLDLGDFLIKHALNFVSHWISIDGQGLSLTSFQLDLGDFLIKHALNFVSHWISIVRTLSLDGSILVIS
jgi:hypothetical protein